MLKGSHILKKVLEKAHHRNGGSSKILLQLTFEFLKILPALWNFKKNSLNQFQLHELYK